MATVQTERILHVIQPFIGRVITAVSQPPLRLQQNRWSEKAIAIPPVAGTPRGAAEAQDAFVIAVELGTLLFRLQSLPLRCRVACLQPRLDRRILRKQVSLVSDQILEDGHVGQRINRGLIFDVGDEPRTCQPVGTVDIHRAGTAHPLAAGIAKGECGINVVFDQDQRMQDHWAAVVKIDGICVNTWISGGIWIVSIHVERLGAYRTSADGPCSPAFNA